MAIYVRSTIWVDVACHANDGCVARCQVPIDGPVVPPVRTPVSIAHLRVDGVADSNFQYMDNTPKRSRVGG